MRRNHSFLIAAVAALGALSPSCSTNDQTTDPGANLAVSQRGNLRFKGPERLNGDIAAALELSVDAVCTELGLYQCTSLVHNVALGGVDPYVTGLYEAAGVTASATPLVVERVAWSACTKRADADYSNLGAAVIFRGLQLSGAKLANPDGAEVRSAIAQLTQRVLLREPSELEVSRYVQLAKDIEGTSSAEPARAWMQAVCFAVVSSPEAVFY